MMREIDIIKYLHHHTSHGLGWVQIVALGVLQGNLGLEFQNI